MAGKRNQTALVLCKHTGWTSEQPYNPLQRPAVVTCFLSRVNAATSANHAKPQNIKLFVQVATYLCFAISVFLLFIWSEIATSESPIRLEIKLCRPKFIIGRQQVTCLFSKKISHCQRKESKENLFRCGGTTRLRGFCSPEHSQPCLLHHSVGIAATSCLCHIVPGSAG